MIGTPSVNVKVSLIPQLIPITTPIANNGNATSIYIKGDINLRELFTFVIRTVLGNYNELELPHILA